MAINKTNEFNLTKFTKQIQIQLATQKVRTSWPKRNKDLN